MSFEYNLTLPKGIATSMEGKFIVADIMKAKVFDSSGTFLHSLCLSIDDDFLYDIVDVDTDEEGNVYLLIWVLNDVGANNQRWYEVFVFDKDGKQQGKFPLREQSIGRKLAVLSQDQKTEVMVLEGGKGSHAIVEVYEANGTFVCQHGERVLMDAQDIVAANKGHFYVLDTELHESMGKCVHEFSAEGKLLRRFRVDPDSVAITFDRASEYIVVVSSLFDPETAGFRQNVSIYDSRKIHRKFLHSYEIDSVRILLDVSVTVNTEGLIAVALAHDFNGDPHGKLIFVDEETTKRSNSSPIFV